GWNLVNAPPLLGDNGVARLLVWIVCVFVSILLHEFGHIWMGKLFGTDGHIVLHGFGGLAIGSNALYSPWKRILVSAAGPGIQLLLWGALLGLLLAVQPAPGSLHPVVGEFLRQMLWINLAWPILNLLPIWPLDGGQ